MIVCFHMAAFLVNEYFFTPEWLREARDITRELVECMNNYSYSQNSSSVPAKGERMSSLSQI